MKTYSHGRTLPALPFEVVPIQPLPAHDRAPLTGVEVHCLDTYEPFPIGRKAEMVRRARRAAVMST